MRIRIKRKRHWNSMEIKTVQGLLVFFGFGLEITISSNMSPTSCLQEQDVRRRSGYHWLCCRLRVRCLPPSPVPARCSRRRRAEQQYQNSSTFLPQSLPPEQRRKREAPG